MRKWSIKARLTFLYGGFMVLLIFAALGILFSLSSQEVLSSVQSDLRRRVQESVDQVHAEDSRIQVDSDFYNLENDIYLSVYSQDGVFLFGRVPAGFDAPPSLENDSLVTVTEEQEQFYVFDLKQQIPGYGTVFIRGITSVTKAEHSFDVTRRFALVLLPVLAAFLVAFSYRAIRRALLPVRKITETVKEIREHEDLSRRVDLPDGRDEIYHLADTFDQLLSELDAAFAREKQFTSDVSHELRTPAAVILLQCTELLRDASLTEEQKEKIRTIQRKAEEMSSLISQLLLLSRADQGRQILHKEMLDISSLTEVTAEEQQLLAEDRGITIRTSIQPGMYMPADESFFIRLLVNLLENAISYGKENGHIDLGLTEEESEVVLSVEDDGIGISEEDLPRIWDRFYRADTSRDDSSHSGLGLSMVRWIVKEHGGTIHVQSRLGEGTVFTCRFPLKHNFLQKNE